MPVVATSRSHTDHPVFDHSMARAPAARRCYRAVVTLFLTLPLAIPLSAALGAAPLRAVTQKAHLPADVVTLALVGREADVTAAFTTAGWTAPDRASVYAVYETLVRTARP